LLMYPLLCAKKKRRKKKTIVHKRVVGAKSEMNGPNGPLVHGPKCEVNMPLFPDQVTHLPNLV
jgi:hypothetical protein